MHKEKPLIVERPWWKFWRHSIFPWGWYQISDVRLSDSEEVITDGRNKPNDGGGGTWRGYDPSLRVNDNLVVSPEPGSGRWVRDERTETTHCR